MNPLLRFDQLPAYDQATPALAEAAIDEALLTARTALEQLETKAEPTWGGCVAPRLRLSEPLEYAWGIVSHMHSAMNSPAWRSTLQSLQPHVISFFSTLEQHPVLFDNMRQLRNRDAWNDLSGAQQRLLESLLRDAEHAGAGCPPDQQALLTRLREQNAADAATFTNHLLDATNTVILRLQSREDIAGLPPSLLQSASDAAIREGTESSPDHGPWLISLEAPLYIPFMQHSTRRDLRETLYRAYCTRASDGESDNTPLIQAILKRRKRIAQILGFESYATLTLTERMAPDVHAVRDLTDRLRAVAYPAAKTEQATLEAFARAQGQTVPLAPWDIPYWAEQLRQKQFSFDDEQLRPYFSLPAVLDGLFQTATRLFDIRIQPADGEAPVWHPDVRFFAVLDKDGTRIAHLYLDPYSRPETKRGGAWMNPVLSRKRKPDGTIRLPAAMMICNQARPNGNTPSLMTLSEANTLFHEFGHALHHILTTVELAPVAGVENVEWDAVELPSQFMENWLYQKNLLQQKARHIETGLPIPDELIDQILQSRWFRAASQTLRQLFFGALDLHLHHAFDPEGPTTPDVCKTHIAREYTITPLLPEDRFLCGFSHIFAGGYAAGYYSYKWAEVLAADAFAAFEEVGLDNEKALTRMGQRFRATILASGGSQPPMAVFRDFRGREPDPDALLRQAGLAP